MSFIFLYMIVRGNRGKLRHVLLIRCSKNIRLFTFIQRNNQVEKKNKDFLNAESFFFRQLTIEMLQ